MSRTATLPRVSRGHLHPFWSRLRRGRVPYRWRHFGLDPEGRTTIQITGWLASISERFAASEGGPVPAWASNTMRTLRMLYVMADRGVRLRDTKAGEPIVAIRHGIDLRTALADVLRLSWPYLG